MVDSNTKYYGQPIVWIIADKNHEGYPANTVTLISEKILCLKAFDATEPNNNNTIRKQSGNNRYKFSNLLQWLNSSTANWYKPQHETDAPPNSSNVNRGVNPYDSEEGFLYNFSSDFKNILASTNFKTVKSSIDGGGSEDVASKIFLASLTEVGLDNENGIAEGAKFPIFDDDESRKAYPTAEAISKNNDTSITLITSNPWKWWLRTPYTTTSHRVRAVRSNGFLGQDSVRLGNLGVRPLCNVKDNSTFFEVIK